MVVGSRPEVTEGGRRPPEVTGGRLPTTIFILLRFQVVEKRKKEKKMKEKSKPQTKAIFLPKMDSSTTYQKMGVLALTVAEILAISF